MQDAIISVPSAPKTTLSIDSIVYIGLNQIRRNIGKTTSFYQGVQTVDRMVLVPFGSSVDITEALPINCLVIDTDSTVSITLNSGTPISVRKHFMCDMAGITTIRLTNASTVDDANVHVTYLS
jgi:hypothetical protein